MSLALGPARPPLAEVAADLDQAFFALAVLAVVWLWSRAEWVRRSLLSLEDPRTMAVFRVLLAAVTFQCFWGMRPQWRVLFSDEGVAPLEAARAQFGWALAGWSASDGFFDLAAVGRFFTGRYSLFLLEGSPAFVDGVLTALLVVLVLFALGVASRVTGVVAMVLMCSAFNRNDAISAGMDDALRVYWLVAICARTGHAWSFDNWLRCRRLRRRGALLSTAGAPGPGEAPIYRMIPAWPRYLMMLQLVAIYVTTGLAKTGAAWQSGDALYYAINQELYYRFEGVTQVVSAYLGTNVFRLMTHVTRAWEVWFGLLALGMILRFELLHRGEAWHREMMGARWRVWLGRAALVGMVGLAYGIHVAALPYMTSAGKGASAEAVEAAIADGLRALHLFYGLLVPLWVGLWILLDRRPLWVGRARIDAAWIRRWVLGRRVWLGLGLCFHGLLLCFLNLGSFPTVMMATYVAFFRGDEIVAGVRWLLGQVRRRPALARLAPASLDRGLVAAARASTRAESRLPDGVVAGIAAVGVGLVAWRAWGTVRAVELRPFVLAWVGASLAVAGGYGLRGRWRRGARGREDDGPALAYGPLGRTLALGFTLWHGGSMMLTALPTQQVLGRWRLGVYGLYDEWLAATATATDWMLFAPDVGRGGLSMRAVVVGADGGRWELAGETYAPGPVRLGFNRMRRLQNTVLTRKKAKLRDVAALECREWWLERGEWPATVELYGVLTRIPSPEEVRASGPVHPAARATEVHEVLELACGPAPPVFMRERRGLPVSEAEREAAAREAERQRAEDRRRREAWLGRE